MVGCTSHLTTSTRHTPCPVYHHSPLNSLRRVVKSTREFVNIRVPFTHYLGSSWKASYYAAVRHDSASLAGNSIDNENISNLAPTNTTGMTCPPDTPNAPTATDGRPLSITALAPRSRSKGVSIYSDALYQPHELTYGRSAFGAKPKGACRLGRKWTERVV